MANASDYYIGANDEHGLNPPTAGKRTPVMPYLNRSFYENEFNRMAKYYFMLACLRCGFRVYDVKPELRDIPISTRVARVNARGLTLVVTFAYNAYGDALSFNNVNGYIVFYSRGSYRPTMSRLLAYDVSAGLSQTLSTKNMGVGTLSGIGMLSSVRCPSVIVESGFMTNLEEAKLMLDPDFQQAVGEGACRGVCEYLDVPFVEKNVTFPTLRRGSRGNYVLMLQYMLNNAGQNVTPDGVFGSATEAAVKAFQTENGLASDGIVGRNTWTVLRRLSDPMPVLRRGSRGVAVRYLQNKLASKLYDAGTADGVFGANTERAVREFQTENGLVSDGIVGKNTWAKLMPIGGGRG